jgi:hypothetical protein
MQSKAMPPNNCTLSHVSSLSPFPSTAFEPCTLVMQNTALRPQTPLLAATASIRLQLNYSPMHPQAGSASFSLFCQLCAQETAAAVEATTLVNRRGDEYVAEGHCTRLHSLSCRHAMDNSSRSCWIAMEFSTQMANQAHQ